MPVFVEGNHIYFSLLLQLGKTSANSYPSLHLMIDSYVRVFKSSRFELSSLLTFWPLEKLLEYHALFSSCLPIDLKNVAHSHH